MRIGVLTLGLVTLTSGLAIQGQERIPSPRNANVTRTGDDASRASPLGIEIPQLTHGEVIEIRKFKEPTKLRGVHVWTDRTKNRLYLRTRPNTEPLAVPFQEIEAIERVEPARPEIHTLVITNGSIRSETYYATTLSKTELEQLKTLQRAEDELADREFQAASLAESVRVQTTSTNESTLWAQYPSFPGAVLAYPNLVYYFQYPSFGFTYSPTLYYPGFSGYAPPSGYNAGPSVCQRDAVQMGELLKALATAQDQVMRARQSRATLRSQWIEQEDGQIIAVGTRSVPAP